MAQTEDTELRDLVIDALEKNGSLAKIRALLRANVFLVFEDEGQNMKQNVSLDNILKLPEGALCLSIIHEFLEFCNLKNTLFVYMAESRQGTEYKYEGKKRLADKLNFTSRENTKEPILVTLLKQVVHSSQRKYYDHNDTRNVRSDEKLSENNFKDDQNCTYIVHEDSNSSATSNSQSDNSSDEKNKLHLRLQLDNSDTDTSSDSTRDKSSSEYVPNEQIVNSANREKLKESNILQIPNFSAKHEKQATIYGDNSNNRNYLQELKLNNNTSSSDSTSYVDLKPYNPLDKKLLNTAGVPIFESPEKELGDIPVSKSASPKSAKDEVLKSNEVKFDSVSETLSTASLKNEEVGKKTKSSLEESVKSDAESADYSNDFTSSGNINKGVVENLLQSPTSIKEDLENRGHKNISFESPRQSSQSSQSSISISDVADLISEKSSSFGHQNNDNNLIINLDHEGFQNNPKKEENKSKNKSDDDSADFSESPIPSLSNLSIDINSD